MPSRTPLKQIVTSVNDGELKQIREYVKRHGLKSVYALIKKSLFEYMERHP